MLIGVDNKSSTHGKKAARFSWVLQRSTNEIYIVIVQRKFPTKTENHAWQSFADKIDISAVFLQDIKSLAIQASISQIVRSQFNIS